MYVTESFIEEIIVRDFENIFKGKLRLIDRQPNLDTVGRPDFIAVWNSTGIKVVIELKKDRPTDRVIGQLSRYMGCLSYAYPGIQGMVMCQDADDRLIHAIQANPDISLAIYNYFPLEQSVRVISHGYFPHINRPKIPENYEQIVDNGIGFLVLIPHYVSRIMINNIKNGTYYS